MFIALADPKSIPTVITWVPRGRRNPAARPECVKYANTAVVFYGVFGQENRRTIINYLNHYFEGIIQYIQFDLLSTKQPIHHPSVW